MVLAAETCCMFENIRIIKCCHCRFMSYLPCVCAVNFTTVYRDTTQIVIVLKLKKKKTTINKLIKNRSKHRNLKLFTKKCGEDYPGLSNGGCACTDNSAS